MAAGRIDAWASWPHYAQHIQPVWDALPPHALGQFQTPPHRPAAVGGPILVASHTDYMRVKHRPVIFIEHGAGQTYVDSRTPAGYAGGPNRGGVKLFLCPSERVADANAKAYPQAKSVAVGSPWVEWLGRGMTGSDASTQGPDTAPAFSFHWDCRVSVESRSAWPHYRDLAEHVDVSTVLGHSHPRSWSQLSRWWKQIGAEPVQSFADLAPRASVYVCDNSSTIYEAAALDIPVVLLNSPDYRRDVWHGLRFWEHLPGPMVDRTEQIPRAIEEAPEWYMDREKVTQDVYGRIEGSAQRAAAEIVDMLT